MAVRIRAIVARVSITFVKKKFNNPGFLNLVY